MPEWSSHVFAVPSLAVAACGAEPSVNGLETAGAPYGEEVQRELRVKENYLPMGLLMPSPSTHLVSLHFNP